MNASVEKCLLNLCESDKIDRVSQETLTALTDKYPYFSIGQMLLSKKMQSQQSPAFLSQVQKTALFFNNPSWLHFQLLNQVPSITVEPYEPAGKEEFLHTAGDYLNLIEENLPVYGTTETMEAEPKVILTDGDDNVTPEALLESDTTLHGNNEAPINETGSSGDTANDQSLIELLPGETTGAPEDENTVIEKDKLVENIPITTEFSKEELDHSGELAHTILGVPELTQVNDQFKVPVKTTENETVPITTEFSQKEIEISDELAHQTLSGDELKDVDQGKLIGLEAKAEDIPITEAFSIEEINDSEKLAHKTVEDPAKIKWKLDLANQSEDEADDDTTIEPGELPHISASSFSSAEMLKNIKSILDTPLAPAKAGTENSLIPIDPYHTVDYFASQGIKLVLDNNPNDKLGRQLKSFTQWLKHMKKLGPEDSLKDIKETEAEAKINNIADSSNKTKEVVTEAMADVLIKQGKTNQAIEVYTKLSFLYPDKSTYFANQIKNLKGI